MIVHQALVALAKEKHLLSYFYSFIVKNNTVIKNIVLIIVCPL